MPDVPYLTGGEELTAARMNTLFEEQDRRAGLCLDGHCIQYLLGENSAQTREDFAPYLGPTFHFVEGNQPISGYWGTWSYDHSVFQAALASATEYSGSTYTKANESKKWVRINPIADSFFTQIGKIHSNDNTDWRMTTSLFRFSLEAHRILHTKEDGAQELFWPWEMFNNSPPLTDAAAAFPVELMRIRTLDQAELMFEGKTGPFDIPFAWNRFLFFRCHNMNGTPIEVRFKGRNGGTDHTLTVPAYGSKCIRRTPLAGTTFPTPDWIYTEGFSYFQKFLAGDPRFYQHQAGNSLGANNVCNPSIAIPFVNRLLAGGSATVTGHKIARPTAILDYFVRGPLPTVTPTTEPTARNYSAMYAGVADSVLLGDLLHCKGQFIDVRTDSVGVTTTTKTFNGYENLGTIDGLQWQEVDGTLQVKTTDATADFHDLIATSANLFATPNLGRPVVDITDWANIDRHAPAIPGCEVRDSSTSQVVSYNQVGAGGTLGPAVNLTITRETNAFVYPADVRTMSPHRETLGDTKERYYGQSETGLSTFTISASLSASGLVIATEQFIPFDRPWNQDASSVGVDSINVAFGQHLGNNVVKRFMDVPDALGTQFVHIDKEGGGWVIKRFTAFTGYGFPDVDNANNGPNTPQWAFSGFLTGRLTRMYSDAPTSGGSLPIAGTHPDFSDSDPFDETRQNADGRDAIYNGNQSFTELAVQLPTPVAANDNQYGLIIGRLNNPDVLYGAVRNVAVEGYWNGGTGNGTVTNRQRCAANQIYYNVRTDGSDYRHNEGFPEAQGFYRFCRMEMGAEHYNNLAAKCNSIILYIPLNWIDHGVIQNGSDQTFRFRFRPRKGGGIFDAYKSSAAYVALTQAQKTQYLQRIAQFEGMRPSNQYHRFTSTTDTNYALCQQAGIEISNITDLPDDFSTVKNKTGRNTGISVVGSVSFTDSIQLFQFTGTFGSYGWRAGHTFSGVSLAIDSVSLSHLETGPTIRPDLSAVTEYWWVTLTAMESYALSKGYQFLFADIGPGFDLTMIELDEADLEIPDELPVPSIAVGAFDTKGYFNIPSNQSTAPTPADFTIPSPLAIESTPTTMFATRFIEFVKGENWIAGDTQAIQAQAIDWADPLPLSNAGASSFVYDERVACEVTTVTSPLIGVGINSRDCAGVLHFGQGANASGYVQFVRTNVTVTIPSIPFTVVFPEKFPPHNWQSSSPIGVNAVSASRNPAEYTTALLCDEPLIVTRGDVSAQLVSTPVPALEFTPNFSQTSANALTARRNFGTIVIPFTVEESGARVQLFADFAKPV
jgi:hypothetical protein